jgi:phage virion morphogenesis protein
VSPKSAIGIDYDDSQVREGLARLINKVDDPSPALEEIGNYMLLVTDERFAAEKDPGGKPWKKNSAFTIALKKQRGQINKILQATGRLRDSINYKVDRARVQVGTNVVYAAENQLVRPFLGVNRDDLAEVANIIERHLTDE